MQNYNWGEVLSFDLLWVSRHADSGSLSSFAP